MAYYCHSDADRYHPHPYQFHHSDADAYHYQCNQYNNYQQQYYAPAQSAYHYSDGFNYYQVSNGYCFPVAYNSVAGCSEPKRVEWDGGGGVDMDLTVDEVDDGYDHDDFDPTPYGGGYDIVETYGKPLVASDSICYPRSGALLEERADVVSEAIVPVDDFQCDHGASDDESVSESCCGSEMSDEDASVGDVVRVSGNSFHDKLSSGDGEYKKLVVSDDAPTAYESSSDAPGFCDHIYGYLPCLNKKKNRAVMSGDGWADRPDEDPWKAAADFIFGSLNPYAD